MLNKKKVKKIIIKEEDEYEGKSCIDFLISSMNNIKKKIDQIHLKIYDDYEKEIKNNSLMKKDEEKINEEFHKIYKINEINQENLFDFLNNINQSHIKKYKKIFKFLNLNLISENSIKTVNEEKSTKKNINNKNAKINDKITRENINKNEENILESSIKEELGKRGRKDIEKKYKKEENEKENIELKINKENNIFEQGEYSNKLNIKNEDKIFKSKKEIDINVKNPIYINNKNEVKNIKQNNPIQHNIENSFWKDNIGKKEILNFNENKNDDKDIDNEIIINENDDSFDNINMNSYIIKNKRNKYNKISLKNSSNNTSSLQEQPTIINDNFDNNNSYFKNDNKISKEIPTINFININKKLHFSSNIIINDFQNKTELKGIKDNNLYEVKIKEKKSKINKNEQKTTKRRILNNKATMNLSYTGLDDKNEICSCIIY